MFNYAILDFFFLKGKENNFKVKHGNTQNLPYDLASIMHYGR